MARVIAGYDIDDDGIHTRFKYNGDPRCSNPACGVTLTHPDQIKRFRRTGRVFCSSSCHKSVGWHRDPHPGNPRGSGKSRGSSRTTWPKPECIASPPPAVKTQLEIDIALALRAASRWPSTTRRTDQ
jgi:hypothetical protein